MSSPPGSDTIFIPGGTLSGAQNAGLMETLINGDTTLTGTRIDPNRVYALYEGEVYYQLAPIIVNNPSGILTIAGVPNADTNYTKTTGLTQGKTKPIILIKPTNGVDVYTPDLGANGCTNEVIGSLKFENIEYTTMQTDSTQNEELFSLGTANSLPQSLTIDNCLFEFSNVDIFDCTQNDGNNTIGGWPNGAKFRLTNSYFRNMFYPGQWWGGRVLQCKEPIDTLWVENCTITNGGLTFLQQKEVTTFAYFNHNTIVNNYKYWLIGGYYINFIVTNNIFMNQNWVGEDTNVIDNGEDPSQQFQSTIFLDTISAELGVRGQSQYMIGDSVFNSLVSFPNRKVYISNNINYYDPLLITGYYTSSTYTIPCTGTTGSPLAPPSYIGWSYPNSPYAVENIPCEWMNTRTRSFFQTYAPPNGGFIEENTLTVNPETVTPDIANASVVTAMAVWNQNMWGDPRFPTKGNILSSKYIYGDYSPKTVPGLVNGVPSDTISGEGTGVQVGITKFSDLTENFSQTANISKLDRLPIGSLIWNDALLANFNSAADLNAVNRGYIAAGGNSFVTGIKEVVNLPQKYSLSQNYPNPFNPGTNISFSLGKPSNVKLAVYNILGQKIAVLVNNYMQAGSYTYQFNAAKLASGVYIYRIEAGSFVSSKKMILLK